MFNNNKFHNLTKIINKVDNNIKINNINTKLALKLTKIRS